MSLELLQARFQKQLLNETCESPNWIAQSQGLSAGQRLGIYHNAYRARLLGSLRDTFEHTANYLGDEPFEPLALGYIQAHAPEHHNIANYGQSFPDYLKQREHGLAAELAAMDWVLRRAFDGENAQPMNREDLAALFSDGGDFAPVPTLMLCQHHFNTLAIWQAVNQEQVPPESIRLEAAVDVVVWRKGLSPHFCSLAPIEAQTLAYFKQGLSIDQVVESLQADYPNEDIVSALGGYIAKWVDDEMLTLTKPL